MKTQIKYYSVWLLLIALGLMFIILAANGCTITKGKKSLKEDSTQVQKSDSGEVHNTTSSEKNEGDWQRQILIYNRDTTINNYVATNGKPPVINLPAPHVIITESGNYKQEKNGLNYDSIWNMRMDSLMKSKTETVKEKKEEALSFWQIIGLIALGIVVLKIIPNFKIGLK